MLRHSSRLNGIPVSLVGAERNITSCDCQMTEQTVTSSRSQTPRSWFTAAYLLPSTPDTNLGHHELKTNLKKEEKVEIPDEDLHKHWRGINSIFYTCRISADARATFEAVQLASPGISEHLAPFILAAKPARSCIIKRDLYHHIE